MKTLINKLFGRKGTKVTLKGDADNVKEGTTVEMLRLTSKGIECRVNGRIQILSVFPKF